MDRHTRKQLKTDKFAQEVNDTFSFLNEHRAESIRYGLIALGVIVLVGGYFLYTRHETTVREAALAEAMRYDEAIIGPADTVTNKAFPTQAAKDAARTKAFSDLYTKYHGTTEGSVGGLYIAADYADQGKYGEAEKIYKDVVDSAPKIYSSIAELSLAQVYSAEGKADEAEKLLKNRVDHPTELVSSDAAKIDLAQVYASNGKAPDALKLLDPLRQSTHSAVSKQALTQYSDITLTTPQTATTPQK